MLSAFVTVTNRAMGPSFPIDYSPSRLGRRVCPEQVGGTQCRLSLDRQRRRRGFVKLTRCVRIRLGVLSRLSLVKADRTGARRETPAVLAFLGGYSVEMLFAAMDRLVQLVTGRMRTSNRPGQPAARSKQDPTPEGPVAPRHGPTPKGPLGPKRGPTSEGPATSNRQRGREIRVDDARRAADRASPGVKEPSTATGGRAGAETPAPALTSALSPAGSAPRTAAPGARPTGRAPRASAPPPRRWRTTRHAAD